MNANQIVHAGHRNLAFFIFIGLVASTLLFMSDLAHAWTGGDSFNTAIKEWIQGTLGRIIAGTLILVGIVAGIARQSLMAFAMGIGCSMGLYNAPLIVESIMTATLPVSATLQYIDKIAYPLDGIVLPSIAQIGNNLGI